VLLASQLLPRPAPLEPWPRDRAPRPFAPHPELIAALAEQARSRAARESLAALAEGRALAVLAGQQPCFPMPLGLSLFKAASALVWAAGESERLGLPVCAIFWSGGDDSDFEEARGQMLRRRGGSPLRVSLAEAYRRQGSFVGDLPLAAAWAELSRMPRLLELSQDLAPRAGEDLGRRECRLLAERFAEQGLLCLDARAEGLRRAARDLFQRYAARREAFSARLNAAGDALVAAGEPRPLREGLGERALFFLRRRRRSLPEMADYAGALEQRLRDDPPLLSPNASLRPLVQDAVLPVVATVLGPSEWEYHRQLRPLFELMDLSFPLALPRLRLDWAREAALLPDAERYSSPLQWADHPLGDPERLMAAAEEHFERWRDGELTALRYEGD
jgi:uncharacterized protein YllA (UPF0747 family)